jgi:hypothetical protein
VIGGEEDDGEVTDMESAHFVESKWKDSGLISSWSDPLSTQDDPMPPIDPALMLDSPPEMS